MKCIQTHPPSLSQISKIAFLISNKPTTICSFIWHYIKQNELPNVAAKYSESGFAISIPCGPTANNKTGLCKCENAAFSQVIVISRDNFNFRKGYPAFTKFV